ncbi:MAG: hypothetical protein A2157_06985 [Deltaproteobacteria bacterium RBG_16_47_11]|nr:MAG: hypothetical protein A2157_06985 [Deltaproteobacteria bacterium RBG_16_47_11]
MKKWLILIGILVVLLIGGYFVLTFYAVKLIQPRLQTVMGPGFTLEEIKLKTTYLSARGIQYEDPRSKQRFFQAEEIRIYPSILSLLKNSLHIKEFTVLRPSFFFYRSREGHLVGPWVTTKEESEGEEISKGEPKKRGEAVEVQIDRIRIQKGSVDFEDKKVGDPPSQIKLRELDFEIGDIRYPLASFHSPVELNGKMEGKTQEGSITLKGWIDAKTMDMETSLKIRAIEIKTFEPYYRKRVTAEIESGSLDMDSRIAVKEKRLDAPGELDLINLHIKEGGGTVLWIPAKTLVSLLEKKGHQIKAKFHVKGNVENPQFNLQETFLIQVAVSFAQALGIPVKVIGEEVLQGTLKGEKGLVEELKSMERLFKKKREKKR